MVRRVQEMGEDGRRRLGETRATLGEIRATLLAQTWG